jgi:hypothetical protein
VFSWPDHAIRVRACQGPRFCREHDSAHAIDDLYVKCSKMVVKFYLPSGQHGKLRQVRPLGSRAHVQPSAVSCIDIVRENEHRCMCIYTCARCCVHVFMLMLAVLHF